eukprot:UC1_evm1s1469
MAYVAAVLLMHMEEEEAFWALAAMMDKEPYLKDFYSPSLSRVQGEALTFQGIVARRMPDLSHHMASLGVHPLMYVTPWFMCAFTSLPLWDGVLAMWDMFMLKGSKSFHRIGLAIMALVGDELKDTDCI